MHRALLIGLLPLLGMAAIACGGGESTGAAPDGQGRSAVGAYEFPAAPAGVPSASELDAETRAAIADAIDGAGVGVLSDGAVERIAASGDPRVAWLLADLLRFAQAGTEQNELVAAFEQLTGVDPSPDPSYEASPWLSVTNHLIAWDLPAPPGYREAKGDLFTALEPGWRPFFAGADSEIDWRLVSWGGVLIDDRPLGDGGPCERGCIPALDDPPLTDADGGDWYPDERIVFGVEVGGEAVALPKNLMEVHEMVNMDLGGRRLGIPYCTLCGSAQAYFTDREQVGGEDLVLRTSGLLSRSNKVMYELGSGSVFDTFTGEALSGPLRRRGVELRQAGVVTATWGEWKAEHPDTRILAADGGLGRDYPLDPLGGRDDDGPIFPVGPVDDRLPAQERVVGVIATSGDAVAFEADEARLAIERGEAVTASGVELVADAGGLRASENGEELPAHEAFWFAWSQFHPDTGLWPERE